MKKRFEPGKLTSAWLERVRAVVSYPLYAGAAIPLLGLPLITAMLPLLYPAPLFSWPSFHASWLLSLKLSAGYAAVLGALQWLGRLSGYRPCIRRWYDLAPGEARRKTTHLLAAAKECGFTILWECPDAGFIGVHHMELESYFHRQFPVRVALRLRNFRSGHASVELKLENRAVVIWDTGQAARLQSLGNALAVAAGIDSAMGLPFRRPAPRASTSLKAG